MPSMVALILVPVLLAAVIPAAAQDQAQLRPTPLSLLEALRLALQQNQQLKVAAFEVAVARAQLAQPGRGGRARGMGRPVTYGPRRACRRRSRQTAGPIPSPSPHRAQA